VRAFKELFGENIGRGFSLLLPPIPIPIPIDAYVKWYQTGNLLVPNTLKNMVKNVYISRSARGSFGELDLIIPNKGIRY